MYVKGFRWIKDFKSNKFIFVFIYCTWPILPFLPTRRISLRRPKWVMYFVYFYYIRNSWIQTFILFASIVLIIQFSKYYYYFWSTINRKGTRRNRGPVLDRGIVSTLLIRINLDWPGTFGQPIHFKTGPFLLPTNADNGTII